jgi:hypothetical protein
MGEIQHRLGVNGNYASRYRLRLIAAEPIESERRGDVDFALSYLREYLREEAACRALKPTGAVYLCRSPSPFDAFEFIWREGGASTRLGPGGVKTGKTDVPEQRA